MSCIQLATVAVAEDAAGISGNELGIKHPP